MIFKKFHCLIELVVDKLLEEVLMLMDDGVGLESDPVICNMVGVVDLAHSFNLQKLSQMLDKCEYFPELHVSLFSKMGKTTATITHKGKCMLFGAKNIDDFEEAVGLLVEMDCKYKCTCT